VCFGKGKLKYSALATVLVIGAIAHIPLVVTPQLYINGIIGVERCINI
jgi:hypothetical protein